MSSWQRALAIITINAVLGASILIFAVGFFPHKASLPGLATWSTESEHVQEAPFDKVIFMVVDALRSDFVYGNASNFHFTQSLIRSGAAVPFTGHASPPTITMPRVKAITTGSVPSFVDLVLNFDESDTSSTLAAQDSWLAQLRAKPNSNLVMLGDDTWLRLFPDFFYRSDGTTSFFVSDFTEVDTNVTRHIPDELAKDDWSGLIMHFLGLDHIGHKTGPKGPNMPGKQLEMDAVVKQIYTAMEQQSHLQSSVLVLLGDHGMNEAGNHGANSAGEVSTALAFISPRFKATFHGQASPVQDAQDFKFYEEVEQSDIAPTLAALLGFPVPRNNLGSVIAPLLSLWTSEADRLNILLQNAEQIKEVAAATYPDVFDDGALDTKCKSKTSSDDATDLACQWQSIKRFRSSAPVTSAEVQDAMKETSSFLRAAQSLLSGTASKYDLTKMYAGTGLAALALVGSILLCDRSLFSNAFSSVSFFGITVVYSITMFASSYVEEEHQFWYWTTAAWLVTISLKTNRMSVRNDALAGIDMILLCGLFGVVRRWNQTGQKYAGDPDLITDLSKKAPMLLWIAIFASYSIISQRLRKQPSILGVQGLTILPVLVAASALLFKIAFTAADAPELLKDVPMLRPIVNFAIQYPLLSLARVVFLGLANLVGTAFYYEKPWLDLDRRRSFFTTFHNIFSLLLMTQTRTVNIPLFLIFHFQVKLLQRNRRLHPLEITITSLLMQQSSFYAFGGTNAISSVDLSNAYNGVGGYNVIAVGILTFLSNWAAPIWWSSATVCILQPHVARSKSGGFDHFGVLTTFVSTGTLAVMVACTILREHLFIWTVFSPKYLYTMAWVFAQHMVVNGIFGCLITGGGSSDRS